MRLVIEREGGYVVVESSEIATIDICSDGVDILMRDKTMWSIERETLDKSIALADAIAARCGVLVEPLTEQEEPEADGLEDAAADDAMGAAMAALVRKNTTSRRVVTASQWVAGEPPKDGRWYVVARAGAFGCVAWDGMRFRDWYSETVLVSGEVAHLPHPLPPRR